MLKNEDLSGPVGRRRALKAKERNFISAAVLSAGYATQASAGPTMAANQHERLKVLAGMGVFSKRYVNAHQEERGTGGAKARGKAGRGSRPLGVPGGPLRTPRPWPGRQSAGRLEDTESPRRG